MLGVCRNVDSVLYVDRYGLYIWHMQQQRGRLLLVLTSNGKLDMVLLRRAKLVHPRTSDLDLEDCSSVAAVHGCLGDA